MAKRKHRGYMKIVTKLCFQNVNVDTRQASTAETEHEMRKSNFASISIHLLFNLVD